MTLYMPLFRSCTTSRTLSQLHAHLFITGLHNDPQASTKLIESYSEMGSLESSKQVFNNFPNPDSFMWGVLIKCHVWNGFFKEAISLYNKMVSKQTQFSNFLFPSVLRACSGFGDLGLGQKVHGRIIKSGFDSDFVVETSLLSLYGERARLADARKVFDEMAVRDVVSWSSIISTCVQNGQVSEGLEIFSEMVMEGLEPDSVTMLCLADACSELGSLILAKSLHCYVVRREIKSSDGALDNSLIAMYGKCGDLCSAEGLFGFLNKQSTSSYTAMITCYNQNELYQEALSIFVNMQESNVEPNAVTLLSVLCSCARLGWLQEGRSIHCLVIKKVIGDEYEFLGSALIDLYASCGNLEHCRKIFDVTQEKYIVSWNLLISGYTREGLSIEALMLFKQLIIQGILPDSFTLASVLSACGDIGFFQLGSQIHSNSTKIGFLNEFVMNSLIDMYSKCGFVHLAYKVFEENQEKSVIAWNSMICGFSRNGNPLKAILLFDQMFSNCLEMDEVTFLSVIQACSNTGYLERGKWIHHKLITYGVPKDIYINTAVTDMYCKCGDLRMARRVFDSMLERSLVSWSAMIAGYGMHGQIDSAISVFDQMVKLGLEPNDITFMNILSACSHAGFVKEGKLYFESMVRDFGIEPKSEHFACMVDLLSRAGDLDGAYRIIKSMPFLADASIWGALLNGCRIHQRMDMIRSIRRELVNLDTDDTGYYTLLSNIFAEGGEWDEFRMVRSMMTNIGLRKVEGFSAI